MQQMTCMYMCYLLQVQKPYGMIGWVYIAQPDPGDLFVWLPVKRVQFDPTGARPVWLLAFI